MNYRHAYHAGNFADVLKHVVVTLILARLKVKDRPIWVLDSHSGAGLYDLASAAALKTGEHLQGVDRFLAAPGPPMALHDYVRVIRDLNPTDWPRVRWYPGSPRLVRELLRAGDRLVANELHPEDAVALQAAFRGDPRVRVRRLDGYMAWKAFVPPTVRRGLVLVDPPFEVPGEFERLVTGLVDAHRRWATGVMALWYPIKDVDAVRAFHAGLRESGIRRLLRVELLVRAARDPDRLNGCGMIVVNPPWQLAETLEGVLAWLGPVLAQDVGAAGSIAWLVPE
ncbi:MAG: 23S rRNA (adenine(2030)-N(6))-methyltransferase RlmJ [Alphaproteobacteria bacterium]|nr:23S rRNA (adenine(2030)-N(6))-methyltransferase RlmJ [Alphaproteobacteria bacterium]